MSQVTREDIVRISGVNPRKCMKCGKCSGTCPSYDEMEYHPHQFVQMVENGELEPLLQSKSIYACLSCFACCGSSASSFEASATASGVRC